jgi:hypothetical protein
MRTGKQEERRARSNRGFTLGSVAHQRVCGLLLQRALWVEKTEVRLYRYLEFGGSCVVKVPKYHKKFLLPLLLGC